MYVQVLSSKTHVARKEHYDDGWDYFSEINSLDGLSFAERRKLVLHKRRASPYKILPGDKYECQFNKCEGETYTWRMNKELYEIACKLNLFDETYLTNDH